MSKPTPPSPKRRRPPRRRTSRSGFWRGVAQTLSIVVTFVGAGVAAGSLAGQSADRSETCEHPDWHTSAGQYPLSAMDPTAAPVADPEIWLVDGFNALHVALLRGRDRHEWWRGEERERLLERVAGFDAGGSRVVVVFDGQRPLPSEESESRGPRVVFAPSADDWLLRQIRESPAPGRVALVTADRRLADRARHRGAQIVSPRAFLDRCHVSTDGSI